MTVRNTRHLRPEDLRGLRWRGYVRESTEEQAEAAERQRADLQRAATELGMVAAEPTWYERVGTGEARSTELEQALLDGRGGQYDVLLVFHTSRFARNRAEAVRMKESFARAGLVIYFVAQRIISGSRLAVLHEGVSEVIDQVENDTRRMWVAGGLRQRQLSGRWMGRVPLGYRKVLVDFPDGTRGWDGALEPDPVTAPIVRRIFEGLAGGINPYQMARNLNIEGARTGDGRPWTPKAVRHVVSNRVYLGSLVRYPRERDPHYYAFTDPHDGHREIGRPFPGIVDERLWERAQPERGAKWSASVHHYPLSAVLRCGACDRRLTGMHSGTRRYYRCTGRMLGICDRSHVRADWIEGEFALFLDDLQLPEDWREQAARLELRAVIADEAERTRQIDARLARLRNLYAWSEIEEAEYRDEVRRLRGERALMVRPDVASMDRVAAALAELGSAWQRIPIERRRELPGKILRAAVIDGDAVEWVVRAEYRTLIDLCVAAATSASTRRARYTLRYSA